MAEPVPSTFVPRSLFVFSLLYGGLVVLAGILGTKLAYIGDWPLLGSLAVESGIFAFLMLVVLASATAELHGRTCADALVRWGFVPLIMSMILLMLVIHVVPPASFWSDQAIFAKLLGQGVRLQFAGLVAYGVSQTLNVAIFARLAAGGASGERLLWLRAWIAGLLSQIVDTVLFIGIAFYGVEPIVPIMTGQIISKMLLSTILVPPLIYLLVAIGRRLDS